MALKSKVHDNNFSVLNNPLTRIIKSAKLINLITLFSLGNLQKKKKKS